MRFHIQSYIITHKQTYLVCTPIHLTSLASKRQNKAFEIHIYVGKEMQIFILNI